jgi:hypothetical protein
VSKTQKLSRIEQKSRTSYRSTKAAWHVDRAELSTKPTVQTGIYMKVTGAGLSRIEQKEQD